MCLSSLLVEKKFLNRPFFAPFEPKFMRSLITPVEAEREIFRDDLERFHCMAVDVDWEVIEK